MSEIPAAHELVAWVRRITSEPDAADVLAASVGESSSRIDDAYAELLSGYSSDPSAILGSGTTANTAESGKLVVECEAIPFASLCAHHFLPFIGEVEVRYKPGAD